MRKHSRQAIPRDLSVDSSSRSSIDWYFNHFGILLDVASWMDRAAVEALTQAVVLRSPQTILEIGGGRGRLAERLLRLLSDRVEDYLITDLSAANLKAAQKRLKPFPSLRLHLGDICHDDPRPEARYDCVVSSYVVDGMSRDERARQMDYIHRVLNTNGVFCSLTTTLGTTWHSRMVMHAWSLLHSLHPMLVGWSRAMTLSPELSSERWRLHRSEVVCSRGFASEFVVAEKI